LAALGFTAAPIFTAAPGFTAARALVAARTPLIALWDNRGMSFQSKILSVALAGMLVAGGVAAGLYTRKFGPQAQLATGTLLAPSRPLEDFSLIDSQGRSFGPANLRGHWSLMFFGYTNCPDFCPTTLTLLAAVQKRLRADNSPLPQVIFVSVDARRDTPAQLAKFVPAFDPGFIGLTAADQATVEAFARKCAVEVMVQPAKNGNYSVDHSGAIFVLDPAGNIAAILTGPFTVEALQGDFRRILTGHA
jgi:protein SCO1/2